LAEGPLKGRPAGLAKPAGLVLADSVVDPGETIIAQIVPSSTATPSY
jgi:hypothetical protein